jgi:hypothetical protein
MGWSSRNVQLARGVNTLQNKFAPQDANWNIYYYYYATQAIRSFGGTAWSKEWNPAVRRVLLTKQTTERTPKVNPQDAGNWPKDAFVFGEHCGQLGTTALAVLTLQAYYRHPPISRDRTFASQ